MDNPNNLLGVIQTLWRWKNQIIKICVATAIVSVIVCLLLPNYYQASAVFYAASPNLAFPEPVGMESRETEYYGEKDDMDRILTIAESNEVADFLINKYELYKHYEIDSTDEKGHYKVMKRFRKLYNVERTKFNAIEISIEDKDKTRAMNMINDAWKKINNQGQNLIKESQKVELETRQFTVNEKERLLSVLNDSLSKLREKYEIYNTITQSTFLTDLLAKTQGSLAMNRAKEKLYANKGGRFRDSLLITKARIEGAEAQVVIHQARLEKFNRGMALVEAMEDVQKEATEQLAANRERESQLKSTLASEFTAIYLVSPGEMPLNKSRPMRSILVLASVFLAFLFSVIGILLLEAYRNVKWKEILND